jgi:pyridoxamine 5'-phosphate oxidase
MSNIAAIRKEYMLRSLLENEVNQNPLKQFATWWDDAVDSKIEEVNAMTLATVNEQGYPSARIVLLKDFNESGFVFFTNYESRKGKSLLVNPKASIVFFWKELERQVRIEGVVEKISEEESTAYFTSRPVESKIGAWASPQSEVISSRNFLEERFKNYEQQFSEAEIPKPRYWGGYIVKPTRIEFWQGRPGRLHDRIEYNKNNEGWTIERLAP